MFCNEYVPYSAFNGMVSYFKGFELKFGAFEYKFNAFEHKFNVAEHRMRLLVLTITTNSNPKCNQR